MLKTGSKKEPFFNQPKRLFNLLIKRVKNLHKLLLQLRALKKTKLFKFHSQKPLINRLQSQSQLQPPMIQKNLVMFIQKKRIIHTHQQIQEINSSNTIIEMNKSKKLLHISGQLMVDLLLRRIPLKERLPRRVNHLLKNLHLLNKLKRLEPKIRKFKPI